MLLGAGFGYLVYASGSLWPAILGHFINNGLAVFAAWWLGPQWIAEGMDPSAGSWGIAEAISTLVGAIAIVLSVRWLKRSNDVEFLPI